MNGSLNAWPLDGKAALQGDAMSDGLQRGFIFSHKMNLHKSEDMARKFYQSPD